MRDGPGATPLPITFLGLTIATTLYAGFETEIVPRADFHTLGWLVLAVPVPMQFLAAAWGLIRGELAAATGSSVLAATWLALALATITGSVGAPGPSRRRASSCSRLPPRCSSRSRPSSSTGSSYRLPC